MELRLEDKEGWPGQTLPALQWSMGDSKPGLPEHHKDLFIKVGGQNIFYFIVFWLGLYIFNIRTYVSGPPFVTTLTLSPADLRCGPDWILLALLVLKTALPDVFVCGLSFRSI